MTDLDKFEAKLKEEVKGLEPVALHCAGCGTWSAYRVEHNTKLPRGWRDTETGHYCNECRKKGKKECYSNGSLG